LVDYSFGGDYSGTIVRNNAIRTQSPNGLPGYFHVGIGIGYHVWFPQQPSDPNGCTPVVLRNGTVTGNHFDGGFFGYAIAVDGATNWTVTGNTLGPDFSSGGNPGNDPCAGNAATAGAFKKHGVHATGTYQANFVEGKLHHAVAITP
jgi:hypothetical protein